MVLPRIDQALARTEQAVARAEQVLSRIEEALAQIDQLLPQIDQALPRFEQLDNVQGQANQVPQYMDPFMGQSMIGPPMVSGIAKTTPAVLDLPSPYWPRRLHPFIPGRIEAWLLYRTAMDHTAPLAGVFFTSSLSVLQSSPQVRIGSDGRGQRLGTVKAVKTF